MKIFFENTIFCRLKIHLYRFMALANFLSLSLKMFYFLRKRAFNFFILL